MRAIVKRSFAQLLHFGKGWYVLSGCLLGIFVGYIITTVDIEHRAWFAEAYLHATNMIHGALLGAIGGLLLDTMQNRIPNNAQFSWSRYTLLAIAVFVALMAAAGYGHFAILKLAPR
jgi:hypothetical protein